MSTLTWIVLGGVLMRAIAMVSSVTVLLGSEPLDRLLLPLVSLAAGAMIGGACFHMIPAALDANNSSLSVEIAVVSGFTLFLILEQLLHWHHCHRADLICKRPMTYLVLIGEALKNFLLYIGASDLVPEINEHENLKSNAIHVLCFAPGITLLLLAALI